MVRVIISIACLHSLTRLSGESLLQIVLDDPLLAIGRDNGELYYHLPLRPFMILGVRMQLSNTPRLPQS